MGTELELLGAIDPETASWLEREEQR